MKREVIFLDDDRNKIKAECTITERNGYPEFTMSGDMGGSGGQIFDHVKPATDAQHKLIDLWKVYHLNGMSAGSPEQVAILTEGGKERPEYSEACKILKKRGKYTVKHPETGEPFTYGAGWYKLVLPEGFEDDLNTLLDEIEEEHQESTPVTEGDLNLFEDFTDPAAAQALAIMLELTVSEVQDITEDQNYTYCVQGIDYLCGTDDEMDEPWEESLKNYLDECVLPELPETAQQYFNEDAWIEDAKIDGRAHSLNHWNGEELNHGDYYAYRQ